MSTKKSKNKEFKRPNFKKETEVYSQGYRNIAGVDEVGRGPLAGKVTAAAVIFPDQLFSSKDKKHYLWLKEINDSKKLTSQKREELYKSIIKNKKIKWAVAGVPAKIIDKIGIYQATQLAMLRAVKKLKPRPDFVIFDGRKFENKAFDKYSKEFIIKADEKVMSCAAASIIAKVIRDAEMTRLHKKYPKYRFDRHKGYGTREHIKMLHKYGPCVIHRKSFAPCKENYFC